VALPPRRPWLFPLEPVVGQTKRRIVGRHRVMQPGQLKRKTESYFKRRDTRWAQSASSDGTNVSVISVNEP